MKNHFLLWLNALIFCAYLAAHLFDIIIIVPNWSSGTLEDIRLYNDFFHFTDPRHFFGFVRPLSIAVSLVCFILYWSHSALLRVLLGISLSIDILIYVVTLYYFSPINDYLFLAETGSMDPGVVKELVSKWIRSNYIRIALITVGFYTSSRAVHFAYRSR